MSVIDTRSKWYYGHTVTSLNKRIDFDEGSGELTAELNIGDYTLTEYAAEVKRAMDAVGTQTYAVSVNRVTRELTISATNPFDLLTLTGSHAGTTAYTLMGFSDAADLTGLSTYTSQNGSGFEYTPQALLEKYTQAEDTQVKEDAVVNTSASGRVQTVQFGDTQRIMCNIWLITDRNMGTFSEIETDLNARANVRAFMSYAITKAKMEFMPDRDDEDTFFKVLLESTKASRQGTSFQLYDMKAPNFYETDDMVFRVVT